MSSKSIYKIELDGKIIFSKPLILNESVHSIREKIKDRVSIPFLFLDKEKKVINKYDENKFNLDDIKYGKIIRLKSENNNSINNYSNENIIINILENDRNIISIKGNYKMNLEKTRKLINDEKIYNFIFLDYEGNEVDKNDEIDFNIEDILYNQIIRIKFKPKNIDFSKYELIKKTQDLTIYKYQLKQKIEILKSPLINQYIYDEFDNNDLKNAIVVLFFGPTGSGKTTAINALFNIIKGINLEDNFRFLLYAENNTEKYDYYLKDEVINLYYIKDYNNKPLIILDSRGYGDTRGKKYDEILINAYSYVFSNMIDHINCVCHILISTNHRFNMMGKYIFGSLNKLFIKDINENLVLLGSFATKDTINEGPFFIESIKNDSDYPNIKNNSQNLNEKWWYSFDSKCIIETDEFDKITKYSYKELTKFYEEKVLKLEPISTKN